MLIKINTLTDTLVHRRTVRARRSASAVFRIDMHSHNFGETSWAKPQSNPRRPAASSARRFSHILLGRRWSVRRDCSLRRRAFANLICANDLPVMLMSFR